MGSLLTPEFRAKSKHHGYYAGPTLEDNDPETIDTWIRDRSRVNVVAVKDGSINLAVTFLTGDQPLATEVAFIRNPEDWNGYDHHIIYSAQDGCPHNCITCVDGLPGSYKGNLSAAQMAYAVRRALDAANDLYPIAQDAKIKALQLGSGDPFSNVVNNPEFIRNLYKVDPRIKYTYLSTAGATGSTIRVLEALKFANAKGIKGGVQASVHNFNPEERADFVTIPATDVVRGPATRPGEKTLMEALHDIAESGNDAFVNYFVAPGWNNSEEHARLIVEHIPDHKNVFLKLVMLNEVKKLHGKMDDLGNMYVLEFDPALEGKKISLQCGEEVTIKQTVIPKQLQVDATWQDVLDFEQIVRAKMNEAGRNFNIITVKDNAIDVGAQCGNVGDSLTKSADSLLGPPSSLIQIAPAGSPPELFA